MAQKLAVIRIGAEWAVRDVTGTLYGQTPNLLDTIAAGKALAKRSGAEVVLGDEAKLASQVAASVDEPKGRQWMKLPLTRFWRSRKRP